MSIYSNLYESFSVDDLRKIFYDNYYCEDVHEFIEFEVWEAIMRAANFVRAKTNEYKFQS